MSIAHHHSEWLSLVEVSGPFLSMPVLMRVFPQGLDAHDPQQFRTLRLAYEEWEENNDAGPRTNPALHGAWIKFVLTNVLGLPDEAILEQQTIPQTLQASVPEHNEFLRPSLVVAEPGTIKPRLLVQTYPAHQDLDKPVTGRTWKASPGTRMMELLHVTGVRLGLVTNGEQWMLVDAPRNETTGFASWYVSLWQEEPVTLRAFTSLLGTERFFNSPDVDTLEAMLAESASNQQEVTDQLGYQVRRAVEVLIHSIDRADQDHDRSLLGTIHETVLYEAALTVMMRLVFLFSAEERGLLLLNDELYAQNYALSTLREQLRKAADDHGEEILERRHDAWCRLLSTFRAVYGGVKHDRMTLPAYGGHLFDPDRFPFLEGRKTGTTWKTCEADPLPVNNRTVLHLLEALQILEVRMPGGEKAARRVSFRALDIEQIGHVYEGLLDHTAKRATEPMLGLFGTRDREPEVPLSRLEELKAKGEGNLVEFLREETGKSASALRSAFAEQIDLHNANRLQAVCGSDKALLKRIAPFAGLVRDDTFGYPVVITKGSVFVTAGSDRRSSGTHYTPRSLTEPIVQHTLEPLVYVGPAEGKPKEEWQLRPAKKLLDLKICDMACGSGAFLVQACRYLAERLVEAWETVEKNTPSPIHSKLPSPMITPEGTPATGEPGEALIPKDAAERLAYARRIVAQRCFYGVDINPLAAEMAKLSLWLLTLAKDKPFTFLDHAIRCGDSLLGIHSLQQLKTFSLDGTGQQYVFGEEPLDKLVNEAITHRLAIESAPAETSLDLDAKARELEAHEHLVSFLKCAADLLISAELKPGSAKDKLMCRDDAAIQISRLRQLDNRQHYEEAAAEALGGRRTFHWPLEFPEVFVRHGGFSAVVGNPPFRGGLMITRDFGLPYTLYLKSTTTDAGTTTDLCAYFFRRGTNLLREAGSVGLVATNTICEGDTRETSLSAILREGGCITRAVRSMPWPGGAALHVATVHIVRTRWKGTCYLDEAPVSSISASLTTGSGAQAPETLSQVVPAFLGTTVYGNGFFLSHGEVQQLASISPRYLQVVRPFLNGEDVLNSPTSHPTRSVLCFQGMALTEAEKYTDAFAIAKERVFPGRQKSGSKGRREKWWLYASPAEDLYRAIKRLRHVFVTCFTSKYVVFAKMEKEMIFSNAVIVVASDNFGCFASLQSALHETWVREHSSTLETRQRYALSDCYQTFPQPPLDDLADLGRSYIDLRSSLMLNRNQGLTAIYNLFHDSADVAEDISRLRDLHVEMDVAVAAAYGWSDLGERLGHGYHATKHGIRFTISEPSRREVLDRLLRLNHARHAEEINMGLHDKKKSGRPKKGPGNAIATPADANLFG